MNPTRILALARRIVHQFRRDRPTLALLFVVPVLLLTLIAPLLEPSTASVTIGLVALDGPVGDGLLDALEDSEELIVQRVPDEASGGELLREGAIDAMLVVPDGAQAALLTGEEMTIKLHVRGDDGSETGRIGGLLAGAMRTATASAMPIRAPIMEIEVASLYGNGDLGSLDLFAPAIIGFFLFFFVFLLTCVSFLRERVNGTMERLMQSPVTRIEIVMGYMLGFGLFALLQGVVVLLYSLYGLKVYNAGNLGLVFLVIVLLVVGSVNLGIYLSTFARTELQVVQFIPLVITPQALLSGLIFPVDTLPAPLQALSRLLPLTYATEALRAIMLRGEGLQAIRGELVALTIFATVMIALGAFTLRREVA